jgi:hypothetical protein
VPLSAKDELGEDSFELNQATHQADEGQDNWTGRGPEEFCVLAKKHLHRKLTA